jgi:hypothetical protein
VYGGKRKLNHEDHEEIKDLALQFTQKKLRELRVLRGETTGSGSSASGFFTGIPFLAQAGQ